MFFAFIRYLLFCDCALTMSYAGGPLYGFSPAKSGDGALLCILHPQDGKGPANSGGSPRDGIMYICEPENGARAVAVWKGLSPVPVPVGRLTANTFVIERHSEYYLWEMEKGTARSLFGRNDCSFLKTVGDQIFFLKHTLPDDFGGIRVVEEQNGKVVADHWFRPRDKLCTIRPTRGSASLELEVPVLERILETGPGGIWAVTADEPRHVCFVTNSGSWTEIIPFDPNWVARETHAVFSRTKDYLALSVLHKEQDFNRERELIVVDLKRKTICHAAHNIPISRNRSYPPPIDMVWVDQTRLLFGNPFVIGNRKNEQLVLDTLTGLVLPPTDKQLEVFKTPEHPPAPTEGFFESKHGKARFAVDDKPEGSALNENTIGVDAMKFSPDGKWASFYDPVTGSVMLLNGQAQQKHRLIMGEPYDIKWLPSAAAAAGE